MTIIWKSETRKLSELKPYEFNPRTITKGDLEKLKQSITESGYHAPILIDIDNTIIAGHARWHAMKLLKHKEADVRVPDRKLTEHEFKGINIRDNISNGDWDVDMLANHFETTDLLNWGIPESLFEGFKSDAAMGAVGDDDVPPIVEEAEPQARIGDVYVLGNHRLMCGDSTNAEHVKILLNGQSPNTMITDPPYGVKYDGSFRARATRPEQQKKRQRSERDNSGMLKNDNRADWREAYALFPGNVAYVWHADKFTDVVMDGLRQSGFEPRQKLVWVKNNHVLGMSDYQQMHEPCWYAAKEKTNRNWKGGRKQKTVWNIDSIQHNSDDQTAHPTQKPVEIYTRVLDHHTNEGEYVYDPFGGSGTLIIACEKMGRRALSMELDPRFVDLIVNRWERFTERKAELIRGDDV